MIGPQLRLSLTSAVASDLPVPPTATASVAPLSLSCAALGKDVDLGVSLQYIPPSEVTVTGKTPLVPRGWHGRFPNAPSFTHTGPKALPSLDPLP